MSDPITIGAGLGAGLNVLQGKNPLTGALLGGVGGGMFGGAGGFGSGFGGGAGKFLSGLQGVATTPVSMGTGGFVSGIGGQVIPNVAANVAPTVATAAQTASQNFIPQHLVGNSTGMANYVPGGPYMPGDVSNFVENTPYMPGASSVTSAPNFTPVLGKSAGATGGGYNPSFFGRIDDTLGNPFSSLTGRDKLGLGLQGGNMLMSNLEGGQRSSTLQPPSPIPTQYNASAQLDPSLVSMVQRKKYPYMIG